MEDFYRMTSDEVAWGWIPGFMEDRDIQVSSVDKPRRALETLLRSALQKTPCFVEFSGGRDSSALLAVAADVASREGLDPPVPLTWIFPDVSESREDDWQERVIKHLGVEDWERIEFHDETDLLGPTATRSLRRHGLVWPPLLHIKELMWRPAVGGVIVSGEGGDEVFGLRRITPFTGLLRRNVRPRKRAVRRSLEAAAPKPLRRRVLLDDARERDRRHWLRPDAHERFLDAVADDELAEPLSWQRSIRMHLRRRANFEGIRNLRIAARHHQVDFRVPFLDPYFIESFAREGGLLGFPGRTAAMTYLFNDFLPDDLLRRDTKATFVGAVLRQHSQSFIDQWTGEGVDGEMVDPSALVAEWRAEQPHAGTLALLQAAWLATSHIE